MTQHEIASQPALWRRALREAPALAEELAAPGERMLIIGCGTSAFMAQAIATLREEAGLGETDWGYASELPTAGRYARVVALTRSGTTSEVLDALRAVAPPTRRVVITAVAGMPVADLADATLVIDWADEESVVQTRFPSRRACAPTSKGSGPRSSKPPVTRCCPWSPRSASPWTWPPSAAWIPITRAT